MITQMSRRTVLKSTAAMAVSASLVPAAKASTGQFLQMLDAFGETIIPASFRRVEADGLVIEVGAIAGYENVPAGDYHKGVDVAIMRYHSEEFGIPDDYYKLSVKTKEEVTTLGIHPATMTLSTSTNKVAYQGDGVTECFSLTLPPVEKRFVVADLHSEVVKTGERAYQFSTWRVDMCCSNGMCCTCIGPDCPV